MSTRKTLILMLMKNMCVRVFDRLVLDVPSSNTHNTFHVHARGLISCVFESCVCECVNSPSTKGRLKVNAD